MIRPSNQFSLAMIGFAALLGFSCGDITQAPRSQISLAAHRAYSGAPPVIPHEVDSLGRHLCLSCHLHGDARDPNGKLAQRTPHPELITCVQCHLEHKTSQLFVENNFHGQAYQTGLRAQPLGPWLIPHPLVMRENCLGCHHQDASPQLRCSHPERGYCQQCHLPAHQNFPGPRQSPLEE